jgi:hypothetical protein
MATFQKIQLAHGTLLDERLAQDWVRHLADYDVKPLFTQFGRALLRSSSKDASSTSIEDREGWVTDALTIGGAAAKLGYERGPADHGRFFSEYRKSFQSAGLIAVVSFSGNSLPEKNVPAALLDLKFERAKERRPEYGAIHMTLADVPVVLLSECWNDYREMAAKAVYDPKWKATF